ncbi:MAG TPA: aminopeptidase [bacterium]|nr:aminopeptidase [bacterium]
MPKKKSGNEALEKKLSMERKSAWSIYSDSEVKKIFSFCEDYKNFLSESKTERQCIAEIISELSDADFTPIEKMKKIKPGSRGYVEFKSKSLVAFIAGADMEQFRIVGSHVDSPRLDLKPAPLFEDSELALFKTHYYGGIKKYHWVNLPLALHGVVFAKNGRKISVSIGEEPGEPKFIVPDLLPHLASEQMKKTASKAVEGEDLNVLAGNIPVRDEKVKKKIKFNILKKLYDKYGITEEDLIFAELELVPAGAPADIGMDGAMVGAYGQDDKVCAYTSLRALLELKGAPAHTAVSLFVDKEEIGSYGDTGAESFLLRSFAERYSAAAGAACSPERMLEASKAISADVTAALDPNFKSVSDPANASYLGCGVSVEKYGGSGGKYNSQDAHAEYMAFIRVVLDKNKIPWQTGELGRIDIGGGGTIAMLLSRYGMDCVDAGPCLLGMHSPCEVASKADIYSAFKLYNSFFKS